LVASAFDRTYDKLSSEVFAITGANAASVSFAADRNAPPLFLFHLSCTFVVHFAVPEDDATCCLSQQPISRSGMFSFIKHRPLFAATSTAH
jgi:hypothetical protein